MLLALFAVAALAQEPEIQFGGAVQADIRFPIPREQDVPWYVPTLYEGPGISRDQLALKAKLYARAGRFAAKADVDLVLPGLTDGIKTMSDLTVREAVTPVYFEANSLYIEAYGLIPKVDVRIGNQIVDWGVGDRFNPTNNLNPKDLEDVLLFGEQMGNLMARVDYSPTYWLTFSGVWVPIFRPALLPATAPLGLVNVDRVPIVDEELRWRILSETAAAEQSFGYPTVATAALLDVPDANPKNSQFSFRVGAMAGPIDVALSYYWGFSDTPSPVRNHTTQEPAPACNPDVETDCIDGILASEVTLGFPKIQVIGLNIAGEANPFGFIKSFKSFGYRIEVGFYIPEQTRLVIEQGDIVFNLGGIPIERPAGEYAYPGGEAPLVVDGRPFAKWVVGIDYTFNRHLYFNGMWVHGFPGEFGAGDWIQQGFTVLRGGVSTTGAATLGCALGEDGTQCAKETLHAKLGDYVVAGLDIKFLRSQKGTLRLFGIMDLTGGRKTAWSDGLDERVTTKLSPFDPEIASGVIYPEFQYDFGNGLEMDAGVLLQLGASYTKFGDPQNGGSMVFTRAKYSF